jgi:hypothetical protein
VLRNLTSDGNETDPLEKSRMVQYSDDMARVTVVCAHRGEVEDETMMRTQLHAEERLRWMGGTVVDEYSPEVTHVLASTVNDTVRQARADKKYVLKFGWVSDCWIKSTMLSSFAVATTARNHKLELLAGCSIFIDPVIWTDKGSLARKQFRTLGETYGATFATKFAADDVTHYITNKLNAECLIAQERGIYAVRAKWLCECAVHKQWLPEAAYSIEMKHESPLKTPAALVLKGRAADVCASSPQACSLPSPAKRARTNSNGDAVSAFSFDMSTPQPPRVRHMRTPAMTPNTPAAIAAAFATTLDAASVPSTPQMTSGPAPQAGTPKYSVAEPAAAETTTPATAPIVAQGTPGTPSISISETTPPVGRSMSSPNLPPPLCGIPESPYLAVPSEDEDGVQACSKRKRSIGSTEDINAIMADLDDPAASVSCGAANTSITVNPRDTKRWQAANELMAMEESLLSNLRIVKELFFDYFKEK